MAVDVIINTELNGSENVRRDIDEINRSFDDLSGDINRNTDDITSDISDMSRDVSRRLDELSNDLADIGSSLVKSLTLPLAGIGGAALKMAADAEEAESAFNQAFKDLADDTRKWSQDLRSEFGANEVALRDQATTFKSMFDSMKIPPGAGADISRMLVQLSMDISSFKNLKGDEAFVKLRAGIVGESEPLKQIGILVNETVIKNTALTKGIIEQGEALSEQQKVYARYITILEATRDMQGDLSRTSTSVTNKFKTLIDEVGNLATDFGKELLPAASKALDVLADMLKWLQDGVKWFASLSDETKETIIKIAALAAAIGPLTLALAGVVKIAKTVFDLFVGGISTAGKLTGAFAAIVTAGVFLAENWDEISRIGQKVWSTLTLGVLRAIDKMLAGFQTFTSWIPLLGETIEEERKKIKPLIDEKLVERTRINAQASADKASEAVSGMQKSIDNSIKDISSSVDTAIAKSVQLAKDASTKAEEAFKERVNGLDKLQSKLVDLTAEEKVLQGVLKNAYQSNNQEIIDVVEKKRKKIGDAISDITIEVEKEKVIQQGLLSEYSNVDKQVVSGYKDRQKTVQDSLSGIKDAHQKNTLELLSINDELFFKTKQTQVISNAEFQQILEDNNLETINKTRSLTDEIVKVWENLDVKGIFTQTFTVDMAKSAEDGVKAIAGSLQRNLSNTIAHGKSLAETMENVYDDIKNIVINKLTEIVVSSAFNSVMGFFNSDTNGKNNLGSGGGSGASGAAASAAVGTAGAWAAVAVAVYAIGSTNVEQWEDFKVKAQLWVDQLKANLTEVWNQIIKPWLQDSAPGRLILTVVETWYKAFQAWVTVQTFVFNAIDVTLRKIEQFATFIYNALVDLKNAVWNRLVGAIDTIRQFIERIWNIASQFYGFVSGVLGKIDAKFSALLNWIGDLKNSVVGGLLQVKNTIWGGLTDVKNTLFQMFNWLSNLVSLRDIKSFILDIKTKIQQLINWAFGLVSSISSVIRTQIESWFRSVYNRISDVVGAIYWLWDRMRGAAGAASNAVNQATGGGGASAATQIGAAALIPGAGVVNIGRRILGFAHGTSQLVSTPTLFMAGENGSERVSVTPLGVGRDRQGGGPTNVFNGTVIMDEITARKFARQQQSLLVSESLRFA